METDDFPADLSDELSEKQAYLRNVNEELARREKKLDGLVRRKEELEVSLKKVSVKSAFLSGDVSKMRMSESYRKGLKAEMEKNRRLISGAKNEIQSALERKESVEEEIAELSGGDRSRVISSGESR